MRSTLTSTYYKVPEQVLPYDVFNRCGYLFDLSNFCITIISINVCFKGYSWVHTKNLSNGNICAKSGVHIYG